MTLRVLDLFSGIGGFSLGLERTGGFKTVAFCEIEPFPRRILAKHWPEVPCYDDVRTLTAERLRADGICVDVICGGFPCQDVSEAGQKRGLDAARSGLWSEIARLSSELRPSFLIVENVSNLLAGPSERPGAWFGRVLGDLAAIGFDAEWHSIPACAVGAPHERDRVWIVAYPSYDGAGWRQQQPQSRQATGTMAYADRSGHQGSGCRVPRGWGEFAASHLAGNRKWAPEPDVGRVVDGLPNWSHRIKTLGNAVVPDIPEVIGYSILASIA